MLSDSSEITVRQTSGEDEVFRLLVTEQNSPAGPVTIAVGATLADMEQTIRVATWTLTIAGLALTALAGAGTWAVVRRALRPVDAMRAEVADISVSGLDRRVSQPATDDEIRLLADTMNDMLGRLEAGTRAQREFIGAASHELRTPIAVIRHVLEVARASDSPEWDEIADSVLEEDLRMERLVDDLLLIARTGAGVSTREHWTTLDLDDIVFEEAHRVPSTVRIDLARVSAGQVNGDAEQLRRVVRNLLDNALRHATNTVEIELDSVDGRVERRRRRRRTRHRTGGSRADLRAIRPARRGAEPLRRWFRARTPDRRGVDGVARR